MSTIPKDIESKRKLINRLTTQIDVLDRETQDIIVECLIRDSIIRPSVVISVMDEMYGDEWRNPVECYE